MDEMEPLPVAVRAIADRDVEAVSALLDDALGRGFWSLDHRSPGRHVLAETGGEIAGVASACVVEEIPGEPGLESPVGWVRLVAVAPDFRRRGIASLQVREACEACRRSGAAYLVSYAWVRGRTGIAPLAGVLERFGFGRIRRIENFYGDAGGRACPGCGRVPCVCSADFYGKRA